MSVFTFPQSSSSKYFRVPRFHNLMMSPHSLLQIFISGREKSVARTTPPPQRSSLTSMRATDTVCLRPCGKSRHPRERREATAAGGRDRHNNGWNGEAQVESSRLCHRSKNYWPSLNVHLARGGSLRSEAKGGSRVRSRGWMRSTEWGVIDTETG